MRQDDRSGGTERRRERSDAPAEAMRLFLHALAERHGLDALALVDEEGAVVAGVSRAPHPIDFAWIGALGALCAPDRDRGPSLRALVERATAGRDLDARAIVLRGERLCVAAVGGRLPAAAALTAAVERILREALPAVA